MGRLYFRLSRSASICLETTCPGSVVSGPFSIRNNKTFNPGNHHFSYFHSFLIFTSSVTGSTGPDIELLLHNQTVRLLRVKEKIPQNTSSCLGCLARIIHSVINFMPFCAIRLEERTFVFFDRIDRIIWILS